MRRSLHSIQPLNLPHSFWEIFKRSFKFLVFIYLSLVPTNSQTILNLSNESYNEEFIVTQEFTDTVEDNEVENNFGTEGDSKYIINLNAFRRKKYTVNDSHDMSKNKPIDLFENTSKESVDTVDEFYENKNYSNVAIARIYREVERKKHGFSMVKLRIDGLTRKKIFYDFSNTVNRNGRNYNFFEDSTNSSVDITQVNFHENDTVFDDLILTFANNSLEYPFNLTSTIPLTSKLHTTPSTLINDPLKTTNRKLSILGLFELSVGRSPRFDGLSELTAARLAVRHVNERGLLPGYELQLLTNDTECDPGVAMDRYFHALYTERATRVVAVLGSACTDVTKSIAKIVPYWNIVQVSFGSTSPALSDRSEYPLFCRTIAPDSSHDMARIAFIRGFGWDTVTAFSQNEEVYTLSVNKLVTRLEAANIKCAVSVTFAETDFKQRLLQLKDLDTRIIIGSFSQEMIPKIFCEAFRLGMYGAEYAWLVAGAPPIEAGEPPCSRAQLARALEGLVTVTTYSGLDDVQSYSGLTNEMFHHEMKGAGAPVSQYAPQTYDAVWAIALALSKAENIWQNVSMTNDNSTRQRGWKSGLAYFDYHRNDMAEEILSQLGNLSFLGVSGPVSFNGADRMGISAFYQIQGGQPKLVALYKNSQELSCTECTRAEWAGGIPVARRVLVLRVDSIWAPARLAVAVMSATGVALALVFLAFNIHYSKTRSIKLSSPRLTNVTLGGCILVYNAVVLYGEDSTTLPSFVSFSVLCTIKVYLTSAGFSLAYGSMFAKTYRVYRILISNRSGMCKTKLLQDTRLLSLVCVLQFIDVLIVTLWAIVDPMAGHFQNLPMEISATDRSVVYQPQIEVCKSRNMTAWLCALYAYKGLLLIAGVYMAWETRHVKISALNDSKYIGISVYSVVTTSASVVVIGTIMSDRPIFVYILTTTLILLTTTSTLCLVFIPKIKALRSKTADDAVIQSLGFRLECRTRRFPIDEAQELRHWTQVQNKTYKKELIARDKEIERLEKLLAEPLASPDSSTVSIALHRRTELNTVEEECPRSESSTKAGGLPLPLPLPLPPPPAAASRASWPSAHRRPRRALSFSSQPKLDGLCLERRETHGLLGRIRSLFGSRPSSRKASTMTIADPSSSSIASALKSHFGMIAGLVPGTVASCNTLNVPHPDLALRRESYARSGPIILVTDDETCSHYEPDTCDSTGTNKYVAEREMRVNFVLPTPYKRPMSHKNSCDKIKGSPRFPHRISLTSNSLATLDTRPTNTDSVYSISNKIFDEQRRYSHQNISNQSKITLESRWKSTEDALPGPSTRN